MSNQILF